MAAFRPFGRLALPLSRDFGGLVGNSLCFSAKYRFYYGFRAWLRRSSQELRQPYQVVGGRGEGEHPADPPGAPVACLAQTSGRLHPAKHLLDPFARALAGRIARMARCAAIDRRAAPS